jgi:hypothetical protein
MILSHEGEIAQKNVKFHDKIDLTVKKKPDKGA